MAEKKANGDIDWEQAAIENTATSCKDEFTLVVLMAPAVAVYMQTSQSFKDAYALTELIQWVWRSRVRNGHPITLYLPSPRMRTLLKDCLLA